jgi:tetratricopeptide (TPR) repeat protein
MSSRDEILLKMQSAQNLRWEDPEVAEVFARSALEDAKALGCASAAIHFLLADILDDLGKHSQAFTEVREALRLDPFRPEAVKLQELLARKLRASLNSALRHADDPAIPQLYALLGNGGETTLSCHLTMIRHALATGQTDRASALAEAVVSLYPLEARGWRVLADVARLAGNEARASEAEFELGILGLGLPLQPTIRAKA